jgi:hypothetical protein
VVEAFNGPHQEQPGRVRKLMRLYEKQKKLLAQRNHPHIHLAGAIIMSNRRLVGRKPTTMLEMIGLVAWAVRMKPPATARFN